MFIASKNGRPLKETLAGTCKSSVLLVHDKFGLKDYIGRKETERRFGVKIVCLEQLKRELKIFPAEFVRKKWL
tara:strand:- start:178 stop:396 length:219 start_codon:yes stop_codon:yes gene_type:complete